MSLQDKLDAFKADFEAGNTRGEFIFFPILPYISELADQPTTLQLQVRMHGVEPNGLKGRVRPTAFGSDRPDPDLR
jgi:hypothetical protein